LNYPDDDQACDAAFIGGPVALAWSRLDEDARRRARARYLDAIGTWRYLDRTYRIPGEFVIVAASVRNRGIALTQARRETAERNKESGLISAAEL
jgi:hypothetical protein